MDVIPDLLRLKGRSGEGFDELERSFFNSCELQAHNVEVLSKFDK